MLHSVQRSSDKLIIKDDRGITTSIILPPRKRSQAQTRLGKRRSSITSLASSKNYGASSTVLVPIVVDPKKNSINAGTVADARRNRLEAEAAGSTSLSLILRPIW